MPTNDKKLNGFAALIAHLKNLHDDSPWGLAAFIFQMTYTLGMAMDALSIYHAGSANEFGLTRIVVGLAGCVCWYKFGREKNVRAIYLPQIANIPIGLLTLALIVDYRFL